jgi:hypothetical protein
VRLETIELLLVLTILGILYNQDVRAGGPAIVRQEVGDTYYDWLNKVSDNNTDVGHPYSDIKIIDFLSDGTTFTASLWTVSNDLPNNGTTYGIYINVDANEKTGIVENGADYVAKIYYDDGNWSKIFEEWTSYGDVKELKEPLSFSDLELNDGYINLTFDLKSINNPNQYLVKFFTEEVVKNGTSDYNITDVTGWIPIPPREINLSLSPSSPSLRPGEQIFVQVHSNSSAGVAKKISFTPIDIEDGTSISLAFTPNSSVYIPPFSDQPISIIQVSASPTASPRPYTIPIVAETYTEDPPHDAGLPSYQTLYLPITILKPLDFGEQFYAFWNIYGGLISFVFAGFAAGFGAYVVDLLRRRKRRINSYDYKG